MHCAVPVLLLLCLLRIAGREPIEQHLVIVGLRAKDKPKVLLLQEFDMRPVGRQRVLNDDRLHVRELSAKFIDQPLRGVSLAVVLLRPVLFPDRLRCQWEYLFHVRVDDRRAQGLMVICRRAVAVLLHAAMLAPDRVRRMIACPI